MTQTNVRIHLALLLLVMPACTEVSEPTAPTSSGFRSEGFLTGTIYSRAGQDTYSDQGATHSAVALSLSTYHGFAELLRTLRAEGLMGAPPCAGEMPGEDPIPMGWIQGVRSTPGGFEVDVLSDPACEGAIVPLDPGNVDPSEQEVLMPVVNCEENGKHSLLCQYVHIIDPGLDPRNVYPVPGGVIPRLAIDRTEECDEEVCKVIGVGIRPIDPRPDEDIVTLNVDCAVHPIFCTLDFEALDPMPPRSEENGESESADCNAEIAAESEQGECRVETDDGYVHCVVTESDGNSGEATITACTTYTKICMDSEGWCRDVYTIELHHSDSNNEDEDLDRWRTDDVFESEYRENHPENGTPESWWSDEYEGGPAPAPCRKEWSDEGVSIVCD